MDVTASPAPAQPTAQPIPGWTPSDVTAVPSTLRRGVAGVVDTLKGVGEQLDGQPLSDAQVGALAPFLADRYDLPADRVNDDLNQVRIYTGGPSGIGGSSAIALGHNIYVNSDRTLENIMSWPGRRLLSHELGHTMQWRRTGGHDSDASDLARTRRFVRDYAAGMAVDNGYGPGAAPRGLWQWLKARLPWSDRPNRSLSKEIHDAHHAEVEAERVAQAFRRSTGR